MVFPVLLRLIVAHRGALSSRIQHHILGLPNLQERGEHDHGDHRREHVDQPRAVVVRDDELRDGKGKPRHQDRRPDLPGAAKPQKVTTTQNGTMTEKQGS
jgi:hypothetical protein